MKILEIYTDGSSKPNPGQGSWAYCIVDGKTPIKIDSGYQEVATNNQMELQAVIEALNYCFRNHRGKMLYIYTDSQYVERGINLWMERWKERGWLIKNNEQWKEVDSLINEFSVQVQWIRGHNKNKWNEFVDKLCTETITNNK